MIPAVDPTTGRLPPGRHIGTWAELEATFVDGAPQRAQRQLVFRALRLWATMTWQLLPSARLWIDGGFVTHKSAAPFDADVVMVVQPGELAKVDNQIQREQRALAEAQRLGRPLPKCPTTVRFFGLLTLAGVATSNFGHVPLVQPFGGLVDGYFASENDSAALNYWNAQWSNGEDPAHTGTKGYVEVIEHD